MHSSFRFMAKKHGRTVMLLCVMTSILVYVVGRDDYTPDLGIILLHHQEQDDNNPDPGTILLHHQEQSNDLLTTTLAMEDMVWGIMDHKEERQEIPTQQTLHGDTRSKKKNEKLVKIKKHVQDSEPVEPEKDEIIPDKQTSKPQSEHLNQFLSKFDGLDFLVIKNKLYRKKDLNTTAVQEVLRSAGLIEGPGKGDIWPPVLEPSGAALLKKIDLSNYNNEDRLFLESRLEVYEKRAQLVGAACASFSEKQRIDPHTPHLVWDTIHHPNIIFCPNYKVASTTWMMYFLRMVHFNEDNPEIAKLPPEKREEARFKSHYGAKQGKVHDYYITPSSPQKKLSVFKQALRVIIVRHPFTRILSAYRDKMVKMKPKPAMFKFRDLQLAIIAKYRKPDSEENSPHPTFPEFIQHVIDSTADLSTSRDWQRKVNCWNPFWAQCEICSLDFNFIMKLETMLDDERFLITVSDLKELKEMKKLEWRHKKSGSSYDVAPEFYKEVTQEQMRMLYQRYKLDFDSFNYNIDNYLAIAKDA